MTKVVTCSPTGVGYLKELMWNSSISLFILSFWDRDTRYLKWTFSLLIVSMFVTVLPTVDGKFGVSLNIGE